MSTKLSDVFDVEPVGTVKVPQVIIEDSKGDTEDVDFEYARGNYYEIVEASKAAINTALRVAGESENPRAIEVLSGLLKNAADINRQLVQMSKDKQEVKAVRGGRSSGPQQHQPSTVGSVFSGSSASLNKMLKEP